MKNKFVFITCIIIGLIPGCNKSEDPQVVGGCEFTFKGNSYSLSIAPCKGVTSTVFAATGNNQLLTLFKGSIADDNEIAFALDLSKGLVFDSGSNLDNPIPTISVSGNTWTFNGIIEDDNGDSGTISGKCACTK